MESDDRESGWATLQPDTLGAFHLDRDRGSVMFLYFSMWIPIVFDQVSDSCRRMPVHAKAACGSWRTLKQNWHWQFCFKVTNTVTNTLCFFRVLPFCLKTRKSHVCATCATYSATVPVQTFNSGGCSAFSLSARGRCFCELAQRVCGHYEPCLPKFALARPEF